MCVSGITARLGVTAFALALTIGAAAAITVRDAGGRMVEGKDATRILAAAVGPPAETVTDALLARVFRCATAVSRTPPAGVPFVLPHGITTLR